MVKFNINLSYALLLLLTKMFENLKSIYICSRNTSGVKQNDILITFINLSLSDLILCKMLFNAGLISRMNIPKRMKNSYS